ncbi:MAG: homoserine kinase [Actinomycetota bacterium]
MSGAVRHHTVRVPATTANLGPGFDALGLALDLHLAVRTSDRAPGAPRATVRGEGAGLVPTDDDNLVWRALTAACERHGVPAPDVALEVVNAIPLERGLGSSSAAIVAGLALARDVAGIRVGEPALAELATELEGHADNVAPALLGGLVACARDDAGGLVLRRADPRPGLRLAVVVPEARQSTESSRAALPATLDRADVVTQVQRTGHVLGALLGAWPAAPGLAGDRLHEPPRTAADPATGGVLAALRAEGLHAWLSGSGPSVAAVVPDATAEERVRAVAATAGAAVLVLVPDLLGALTCPDGGCGLAGSGGCAQCPRERLQSPPTDPRTAAAEAAR